MSVQATNLFSPDRVLRAYKEGLVIRAIDASPKSFNHEVGQGLLQLNSATYIQEGIPISLFSFSGIALLFDPKKLFVPFAFKDNASTGGAHAKKGARIFIQEMKKYSTTKLTFITQSVALIDGRSPYKCYITPDCNIDAIAAKVQRMHKKRPQSHLSHNELLIRAKPEVSPQTDAVIGIVIPSCFSLIATMDIYPQILKKLPERSFYYYDSWKGNLKAIDLHKLLVDKILEQQKKMASIEREYISPPEEFHQKVLKQYASDILVTPHGMGIQVFSKTIKINDYQSSSCEFPRYFYTIDVINLFKTTIKISRNSTQLCQLSHNPSFKEDLIKQTRTFLSSLEEEKLNSLSIASTNIMETLKMTQADALGVVLINAISMPAHSNGEIKISDHDFDKLIQALSMTEGHRLPLFSLDSYTGTFEPYEESAIKIVKYMGVELGKMRAKL